MTSKLPSPPHADLTHLHMRDLPPRCVLCSGVATSGVIDVTGANRKVSQVSDVSVEETSFVVERGARPKTKMASNRFQVRPEVHAQPPAASRLALHHGCRPKTRPPIRAEEVRVPEHHDDVSAYSPYDDDSLTSSDTGSEDMEHASMTSSAMRRAQLRKTRSRGKGKDGLDEGDFMTLGVCNEAFDSSDDERARKKHNKRK